MTGVAPVQAVGTGSITGTVSPVGGGALDPSSHIRVRVYNANNRWVWDLPVERATGAYTVSGLVAGPYRLKFYDLGGKYANEWHSDKSTLATATPVSVALGAVTSNIDAQLSSGGRITGTVSPVGGGAFDPSSDIRVAAYQAGGEFVGSAALNEATGAYTSPPLATGSYRLEFYDHQEFSDRTLKEDTETIYDTEWYSDKSTFATANPVQVTDGAVTSNIDAQLSRRGSITGTVSPVGGGSLDPSSNIQVDVYDEQGNQVRTTRADRSTGTYTFDLLAPGTYRLNYHDWGDVYVGEWYTDKEWMDSADRVQVTGSPTPTTANVQLATEGETFGKVVGSIQPAGGGPLDDKANIRVLVLTAGYTFGYDANTGPTSYSAQRVPPGTYSLRVTDSSGIYQSQWGKSDIIVSAGQTVSRNITLVASSVDQPTVPETPPEAESPSNGRKAQFVSGRVVKKAKAKKNKKYGLPSRTNAGNRLGWQSKTPKVCTMKSRSKVRLTGKRGKCKLVATAGATAKWSALSKTYKVKVK